jgi:hypothetical protein
MAESPLRSSTRRATVPAVAIRAEPVIAVSLTNGCPRTDHLSALTESRARGADVIQPTKGRRQVFRLWQAALPRRLTRAIDIKDHPTLTFSIHQNPCLFLL